MIDINSYRLLIGRFNLRARKYRHYSCVRKFKCPTNMKKKVRRCLNIAKLSLVAITFLILICSDESGFHLTVNFHCSSGKYYSMLKLSPHEDCPSIKSAVVGNYVHMKHISSNALQAELIFCLNMLVTDVKNFNSDQKVRILSDYRDRGIYSGTMKSKKKNCMLQLDRDPIQVRFVTFSPNFRARYTYGNKQQKIAGVKNMHVNIRSLAKKVFEIKNIVQEHRPHILGLSECELKKSNGSYDESQLKVPGYQIFFPKSWYITGQARVIVYVKKSFQVEQLKMLEDDSFQSIWLKGGFRNSKQLIFCHTYREHTSTLGSSLQAQRDNLTVFLSQWEAAVNYGTNNASNEVHISGDMNLDSHKDKWLSKSYHLHDLSNLVQNACNINNFTQLVTSPTRAQFNSITGTTALSCIDHVYCNMKIRCSSVAVIPFGSSDHDLLSYIRYSKEPPEPSKTLVKRSYKNFDCEAFLSDLSRVDWTPVYWCKDVDQAVSLFTDLFLWVLNSHAPWVKYQKRKFYAPWLTQETKKLIQKRDYWKKTGN